MDWQAVLKTLVAGLGTAFTYLFGGWDAALVALVVFVVLDYIAGVMAAYFEKRLDSSVGLRGIAKKLGMFVLVVVAAILDRSAGLESPMLRTLVIWFLVANEGLSIIENLAVLDVPIPKPLRDALERLRQRSATNVDQGPSEDISAADSKGQATVAAAPGSATKQKHKRQP